MTVGMVLGAAGLLVLTQVDATAPTACSCAGYLLFGVALGLVYAPMSTAAMAAMPGEKVGIASGVLAMDRVLAGRRRAWPRPAPSSTPARRRAGSFADAVAGSTWVVVALIARSAAVLTWAFVRDVEPPGPTRRWPASRPTSSATTGTTGAFTSEHPAVPDA